MVKMTSEDFGKIALDLMVASQIPGAQLDAALAFRELASSLAMGSAVIVEVGTEESPEAIVAAIRQQCAPVEGTASVQRQEGS